MPERTKPKNPPALQVIVTVSGGVADLLFKSEGVAVALYDYDVEGSGENEPGISKDPDGQLCCVRQWEPSEKVAGCESWPVVKSALESIYSRPWKCPDCGRTIQCSYEQLAEASTPVCTDCDTEMKMQ